MRTVKRSPMAMVLPERSATSWPVLRLSFQKSPIAEGRSLTFTKPSTRKRLSWMKQPLADHAGHRAVEVLAEPVAESISITM